MDARPSEIVSKPTNGGNDNANPAEPTEEVEHFVAAGTDDDSTSSIITNYVLDICSQRENEWLCAVPMEFFEHRTNLRGLREKVPCYDQAIALILDQEISGPYTQMEMVRFRNVAFELYKLIHGRYILSEDGMSCIYSMYKFEKYGHCPRILCNRQAVLPIGLSNILGKDTVKVFCGKCSEVYAPRPNPSENLDGGAFGPNVPMLFFFNYPDLRPLLTSTNFTPKLFGFKIHDSCYGKEQKKDECESKQEGETPSNSTNLDRMECGGQKKFGWYVKKEEQQ